MKSHRPRSGRRVRRSFGRRPDGKNGSASTEEPDSQSSATASNALSVVSDLCDDCVGSNFPNSYDACSDTDEDGREDSDQENTISACTNSHGYKEVCPGNIVDSEPDTRDPSQTPWEARTLVTCESSVDSDSSNPTPPQTCVPVPIRRHSRRYRPFRVEKRSRIFIDTCDLSPLAKSSGRNNRVKSTAGIQLGPKLQLRQQQPGPTPSSNIVAKRKASDITVSSSSSSSSSSQRQQHTSTKKTVHLSVGTVAKQSDGTNRRDDERTYLPQPSCKASPRSTKAYFDHLNATENLIIEPESPGRFETDVLLGIPQRQGTSTTYRTTRQLRLNSPTLNTSYERYKRYVTDKLNPTSVKYSAACNIVPWSKRDFAANRGLFFDKGRLNDSFLDG